MDQRHAGTTERRMLMKMCAAGVTAAVGLAAPAAYPAPGGPGPAVVAGSAGPPGSAAPWAAAGAAGRTVPDPAVRSRPGADGAADPVGAADSVGFAAFPISAGQATAAERAVRYALAQLGKPYGYGKTGPDAFDCSGLTQRAWKEAGVSIPRTSQDQAHFGKPVSMARIRPGDLVVYFPRHSHVGIYAGGGRVVVSPRTGSVVSLAPLPSIPVSAVRRP
jgi:peptidoglycan DL-endopeptidase CwlO